MPISCPPQAPRTRTTRVLIADDTLCAEGMRLLLEPCFEVAGFVADASALPEAVERTMPDVVVTELFPSLAGLEALGEICRDDVQWKALVVSHQSARHLVRMALRKGASGYVTKQASRDSLFEAIRTVAKGRRYVSPELMEGENGQEFVSKAQGGKLSPRQEEVLQLLATGKTNKQVASLLQISSKTVEFHRSSLSTTLGLKTIADLTRYAVNLTEARV